MPQTDNAERALAAKAFEDVPRAYEECLRALCGAIEGGSIPKEEKAPLIFMAYSWRCTAAQSI